MKKPYHTALEMRQLATRDIEKEIYHNRLEKFIEEILDNVLVAATAGKRSCSHVYSIKDVEFSTESDMFVDARSKMGALGYSVYLNYENIHGKIVVAW